MPSTRARIRRKRRKKQPHVARKPAPTTATQASETISLHPMLEMQQTHGNQAMMRRVSNGTVQRANPPGADAGGEQKYKVTDAKALLREPPPSLAKKKGEVIPKGEDVVVNDAIQKGGKNYVTVSQYLPPMVQGPPRPWGWTWAGNLADYTPPSDIKTVEKKASAADFKAMNDDEIKEKILSMSSHPMIATVMALTSQAEAISKGLKEGGNKRREQTGEEREQLVGLIGAARNFVKLLQPMVLMTDAETALGIRAFFYRRLNKAVPFYTQGANADILGRGGSHALKRTCNVTSIAMALEGLGKTSGAFKGDQTVMNHILSVFDKQVKASTKKIDAQDIDRTDATSLRLPDYLQLVAIYIKLTDNMGLAPGDLKAMAKDSPGKFEKTVLKAREKAAGMITNSKLFFKFTDLFGVQNTRIKSDHFSKLTAMGGTYRKKAEQGKLSKSEKAGMEKKLSIETYRNAVLNTVLPYINEGSQVVVNLYNHFTRLETLNEDEVIIDDPGGYKRDAKKFTWAEARAAGYFRVVIVLS